ncbi:hypothetical protein DUNSADRAFT_13722 [Dunaliella salina]|uniref:Coatomer subunit gamma n=1 Tax=Dunaliella salina TaxID=3046 RepID=A0ABQ7H325_DUNSA|nr:hypothetical protein DUNSADRAFT_13722 [Dunaliella salina]|eukprot:KAF5841268.1 hypothetical protein DUNSADRAFT_13722 [Dunaliella salina]
MDSKAKDEDAEETEFSPFYGIDKGAVLQEARCFNDPQIDARKCQQVITKLLYLLGQGESFTKKEASEVFFSVTKLFQSKDTNLRRMVYLCIKDICPSADEVIIVTSSLMKDMNSKTDLYRSNSVRVLCKIIDSQLLMQFHAVALLHALRASDRLAISKLVTTLTKANVKSPMAQCLDIPDAKESGLSHLCEFIEDCEFTYLSAQILHVLGKEGPKTKEPSKYIRYIYNRIILENATVRAAAVSSLASFGAQVESLRPRVVTLLQRALLDNDDEVRDRATLYLAQLSGKAGGVQAIVGKPDVSLEVLEKNLQGYLESEHTEQPFDMVCVNVPSVRSTEEDSLADHWGCIPAATCAALAELHAADSLEQPFQNPLPPAFVKVQATGESAGNWLTKKRCCHLYAHECRQLASLGNVFKSTPPVRLTEEDTEYNIFCVKHIFEEHVVFQFDCTNTISEQEGFEDNGVVPLRVMPLKGVGHTFSILRRAPGSLPVGELTNILRFTVKEIDPSTGEVEEEGYADEYQLEDLEVAAADYMKPVMVPNFRKAWEEMPADFEQGDEYGLGPRKDLQEAVEAVMGILGMQACEGTEAVPPNARSHTVLLSGFLVGHQQVLVRMSFGMDASCNVAMKLVARGQTQGGVEAVHSTIQNA